MSREVVSHLSDDELSALLSTMEGTLALGSDYRRWSGLYRGVPCVETSDWEGGKCPFPGCSFVNDKVNARRKHLVQKHRAPFTGLDEMPNDNVYSKMLTTQRKKDNFIPKA